MAQGILDAVIKFADAQCLPLGLVFAVLVGAAIPWVGYTVGQGGHMSIFCVVCLFFIAGLKLKHEEAKAALKAYKATASGLTSILCITCTVGSGSTMMLPIQPAEFKLGMIIFFCVSAIPLPISASILKSTRLHPACPYICTVNSAGTHERALHSVHVHHAGTQNVHKGRM